MKNIEISVVSCPPLRGKRWLADKRGARKGFTLIELLVVVLIIGILAAVAVPQYQKAVEKSKAAQALTLLDAVYQAQQRYYLANGQYATKFADLDMDIPWTATAPRWGTSTSIIKDTLANQDWSLQIAYNGSWRTYVGRISGPYAGSGFYMDVKNRKIICAERQHSGITFDDSNGSYCKRFWGCTSVGNADTIMKTCEIPM